jgi:predicted enzyme related to lactoylglutathione lyase
MGQPVVHFDIGCRDHARAEAFYSRVFGWQMERAQAVSRIDTGGQGINGRLTPMSRKPYHYVMLYVQVDDVKNHLDKVIAQGGTIVIPPVDSPDGTFACITDPDGNPIGLWKPKS